MLLIFFATIFLSLRALKLSEGVAVRTLLNLLSEHAKDAYDAQVNPCTDTSSLQAPWPYVVNALLARFLTDDVLHVTLHAVSRGDICMTEDDMYFTHAGLTPLASAGTCSTAQNSSTISCVVYLKQTWSARCSICVTCTALIAAASSPCERLPFRKQTPSVHSCGRIVQLPPPHLV